MIQDKLGIIGQLQSGTSRTPVVLNVGCGPTRQSGTIGMDIADGPEVDIVGDAIEVFRNMPTGSIDGIMSSHFLEHVDDVREYLVEMVRVLRVGGTLTIAVPHFANPYYYSDPTHQSFFGLYTFSYFFSENIFTRKVPSYAKIPGAVLNRVQLRFNSPFLIRKLFAKAFGLLFNSLTFIQEFHEGSLCYLFPCYDIQYCVSRVKD